METWRKKEYEPLTIWGKSIPGKGVLAHVKPSRFRGPARRPVRLERSEQAGVQ